MITAPSRRENHKTVNKKGGADSDVTSSANFLFLSEQLVACKTDKCPNTVVFLTRIDRSCLLFPLRSLIVDAALRLRGYVRAGDNTLLSGCRSRHKVRSPKLHTFSEIRVHS